VRADRWRVVARRTAERWTVERSNEAIRAANLHCPPVRAIKRFVVAETSMEPTLQPGDGIVGWRTPRIRRGEIRCFEHPGRPGFWLIKRVGDVRGACFEARSDRPGTEVVDSGRFGPVPIAGSYRMVVRLPRRFIR
jgi:Signal peptidase, peptidase S26